MRKKWDSPRRISYAALAVIGAVIVLTIYVNDQISLAEVLVKSRPVVAARDLATLLKVRPDTDGPPTEGRTSQTTITTNTRCRLLRYESAEWCVVGRGNPVKVKLLEGPERGQVVWICSDQIRRLHPLP